MQRLNRFLSVGTETAKVYDPLKQTTKHQMVFTASFDVDGVTRIITLNKEDAENLLNSTQALWYETIHRKT